MHLQAPVVCSLHSHGQHAFHYLLSLVLSEIMSSVVAHPRCNLLQDTVPGSLSMETLEDFPSKLRVTAYFTQNIRDSFPPTDNTDLLRNMPTGSATRQNLDRPGAIESIGFPVKGTPIVSLLLRTISSHPRTRQHQKTKCDVTTTLSVATVVSNVLALDTKSHAIISFLTTK